MSQIGTHARRSFYDGWVITYGGTHWGFFFNQNLSPSASTAGTGGAIQQLQVKQEANELKSDGNIGSFKTDAFSVGSAAT